MKLSSFPSTQQQHHNNNGNCTGTSLTRINTACGAYKDTPWQSKPKQITRSHIYHTHAHTRTSLLSDREIKTTLEQKMKKNNTPLVTASCHSPSHSIGAVETNKSSLSRFSPIHFITHSISFPFFFPLLFASVEGDGQVCAWAPDLNRLLSCSFFLVLTVSVAGCPW